MRLMRIRYACLALMGLALTLASPVQGADENVSPTPREDDVYRQLELLAEVMLSVKKFYYEEKSYPELLHGAIRGMLHALDPYSTFLDVADYRTLHEDTTGSYAGIGIHISIRQGELLIIAPIEDTPGFAAGLQPGDRILAIDGESSAGITMREAVDRLRGSEGSRVRIEVVSRGQTEPREVEIVRERIDVASVKGARMESDQVGYVRITQFAQPTAALLQREIEALARDGRMRALILDLRNNPGGLLDSAIETSDLFLPQGATVVMTQGRAGVDDRQDLKSDSPAIFPDFPIAILINGGSASAAEIVAGALQDHRRAVLIGARTFGKGSVQRVMPSQIEDGSAIRLTTAHYYTPEGRLIHGVGVEPDIAVYVSADEWRHVQARRAHVEYPALYDEHEIEALRDVDDRALTRAVDALNALLVFQRRLR